MSQIPPYQQQPGYSNYPRGSFGLQPDPYRRPPGVYFDYINLAFQLVFANLGTWVLAMLIFYAVYIGSIFVVEFLVIGSAIAAGSKGSGVGAFLLIIPLLFALLVVFQTMMAGLMNMGVKQARNEPIAVGDLFSAIPRTWHVFLATLLQSIVVSVGFLLLIVPGLYLCGLLSMLLLLVVDKKMSASEGLQTCWDNLRPHAWSLFGLMFVAGLIAGAGALACGVGILFTYPVYFVILGLTYNNFFPQYAAPVYGSPIGYESPR